MDEREALNWLANRLPVGDDCYVLEWKGTNLLLTTDMLHRSTDFPEGATQYTIGWRSAAVSISDIAAMGGDPEALLIAYGDSGFDRPDLEDFVAGIEDVCRKSETRLVGGDLDRHDELTVVTTALGKSDTPVTREGAEPGDLVGITGDLGRTGAGLRLFDRGRYEEANELFRFEPRVDIGRKLADLASSMMDISDGLARSLHQLAEKNEVGFRITADKLPYHPLLDEISGSEGEKEKLGLFTGEDFELLFTSPGGNEFELAKIGSTIIGEVTEEGVEIVRGREISPLEDEGYVH